MTETAKLKKKIIKKSLFCFNNNGTRKIKDLQKHANKEIPVTHQSDNTKHNTKLFQFIPWSNFIKGFQNFSPGIVDKVLTD